MSDRPLEMCDVCDDATGRAGRGEDSIYCSACEDDGANVPSGPFCSECYSDHIRVVHRGTDPNY